LQPDRRDVVLPARVGAARDLDRQVGRRGDQRRRLRQRVGQRPRGAARGRDRELAAGGARARGHVDDRAGAGEREAGVDQRGVDQRQPVVGQPAQDDVLIVGGAQLAVGVGVDDRGQRAQLAAGEIAERHADAGDRVAGLALWRHRHRGPRGEARARGRGQRQPRARRRRRQRDRRVRPAALRRDRRALRDVQLAHAIGADLVDRPLEARLRSVVAVADGGGTRGSPHRRTASTSAAGTKSSTTIARAAQRRRGRHRRSAGTRAPSPRWCASKPRSLMNACEQSPPQHPPIDGLSLRGSFDDHGPRNRCLASASTYGVGSNGSSFATPANGQQVQLRTECPQASRVVSPPAASVASAASTCGVGTKCSWKHCRVVTWAMPPAWRAATSAIVRSCAAVIAPPGTLTRIIERPSWR
jgi:hypothetical protein